MVSNGNEPTLSRLRLPLTSRHRQAKMTRTGIHLFEMVPRNLEMQRETQPAKNPNETSDEKSKNESEPKRLVNAKAARNDEGLMVCIRGMGNKGSKLIPVQTRTRPKKYHSLPVPQQTESPNRCNRQTLLHPHNQTPTHLLQYKHHRILIKRRGPRSTRKGREETNTPRTAKIKTTRIRRQGLCRVT